MAKSTELTTSQTCVDVESRVEGSMQRNSMIPEWQGKACELTRHSQHHRGENLFIFSWYADAVQRACTNSEMLTLALQ